MSNRWQVALPGENPELVESLQRVIQRSIPNPAHDFWGMRGGFVKILPDASVSIQLAANELKVTGIPDEFQRSDVQRKLHAFADALDASFSGIRDDVALLRALADGALPEADTDEAVETTESPVEDFVVATAEPAPTPAEVSAPGVARGDQELMGEMVALMRAMHTKMRALEARVSALEHPDAIDERLAAIERALARRSS